MKEFHEDLLQRVLDGIATPAERAQLDEVTASDPALRRRREELEHVFMLLGSARLEAPPAGLRESVIQAIGATAPGHVSTERSPGPARPMPHMVNWGRLLLPVTALALATVLLLAVRTPWRNSAGPVTGTMSGSSGSISVNLGEGSAAVRVEGNRTTDGFQIQVRTGDAPAEVEITALDATVTLVSPDAPGPATSGTVRRSLEARSRWSVQGTVAARRAPVRVVVRFEGGRSATAELRVPAHGSAGP